MKKIIFIACSLFVAAATTISCERDISSLNVNPKQPEVVPSQNLVASSQNYLATLWVTPSVNSNISRFFTQQWTETQYVDETNYNFVTRNQPQNHYNTLMRDVLGPLKQASVFLDSEAEATTYSSADQAKIKTNKKATIELLSIFAWANLVDTFGNVPYTEALQNTTDNLVLQPKYDDAAAIYADLQTRLNAVLGTITPSLPGYSTDVVYKGNMSKWVKFANTLKLQMGLNLADVQPAAAKSLVESAYAGGVILAAADSYNHPFVAGQFANPIYQNLVASGRDDFLPSDVYINNLIAKADPRLSKYFTPLANGTYVGGPYGETATFNNFSHISSTYTGAANAGKIFDVLYVKLMLAEAAARGFNVGGDAATLYASAVNQSMTDSGVSTADAAAYLLAHPFNAANWKQSIGMEAWVALHNRGYESWYFFRRLDYPVLEVPGVADGLVYRMPYSLNEYSTNKTNVEAAASAIGGDKYTTKLFWDKF
ncbi:SusD/RagB family nutrient-binding outer membrane lipoprotein [Kaistella montana]|uniref:SusD/RagB family nutrient-binding outer membrane lipoprotein n=1 Tax=Kaistella montana TaxID=1849733 RepID=A0ABW5K989_9FLAO|nr:SusD/RagB family nutrient-binding outer membrane lipoprotein [Kaistella montana]MCQ4035577.1 SusD/RagB family nutrient-binding outer membrane lipoprotein [Kaistella montana]